MLSVTYRRIQELLVLVMVVIMKFVKVTYSDDGSANVGGSQ